MKRIMLLIIPVVLLSCVKTDPSPSTEVFESTEINEETQQLKAVWICHHPNTKHHGKICVDDFYPRGCYIRNDNTKFCWELLREDCAVDSGLLWQLENCHHFAE